MSRRRFGAELEMFIPNSNLTHADVTRKLQSCGVSVEVGSAISSRNNYRNGKFKIVHDSSVNSGAGGTRNCAFELVSPIMRGNHGVNKLYECVKHLSSLNARVDKTAGYHVHVDMSNTTLVNKKRVAWNWHKFEAAFELLVSPSRRGSYR
eukprot:UN00839